MMSNLEEFSPQEFDANEFRKNIIGAMGDNAVAMSAFIRVSEVVIDRNIRTACIVLDGVPEIHINPDFVQQYATTPEHQFILIYHELMHMILRHGTKIREPNDDIIADALINAMICCQYPQARYTRFFTNLYDAKKFPQNLLRPYSKFKTSAHKRKYRRLYSFIGLSWYDLKHLFKDMEKREKESHPDADWEPPTLLGTHGETEASDMGDEILEPIASKMKRSIKESLQQELRIEKNKTYRKLLRRPEHTPSSAMRVANKGYEQGFSSNVFLRSTDKLQRRIEKRREIEKQLTQHAKQSVSSKVIAAIKNMFPKIPLMTPIPNFRDRYAIVANEMGLYRPFYKNPTLPRDYGACSIYMDVSGSMGGFVRLVYRVASDCKDYLDEKIYLFSNIISPITKEQLVKGVIKSTGGTDFDIIISHMHENNIKKAVIFTDGCARISLSSLGIVKKDDMKILAVIIPGGTDSSVSKFCKSVINIDSTGNIL